MNECTLVNKSSLILCYTNFAYTCCNVRTVYKWHKRSFPLSIQRPVCLWDCGLRFELLLYSHLPTLHPTTYCLAAGIAGGWHLLPEWGWRERDLWTKKRPVGVRDRCLGLQCCTLSQTLCDILYVFNTFAERQHYVGSGISPWWLVYVRYSTLCSGDRNVGMKDWCFCLIWCGTLTTALHQLGCLPLHAQHNLAYSGQFPVKWQLLSYALKQHIVALLPSA